MVLRRRWIAAALVAAFGASEAQEEAPDIDFLEYLGTWADDDEEWLVVAEWEGDQAGDEARRGPESGGEADRGADLQSNAGAPELKGEHDDE